MRSPSSVGVVIVTYNSADVIAECLESIRRASTHPVHVVVVDNDSTDGTPDVVSRAAPQATLIRNHDNLYYAAASNQGLRTVQGEHVLLLNPDTVLPIGGIDALIDSLSSHPRCAAVAPMLVYPDGRRQPSLREFPALDTLWYDLLGLSFLFPRSRRFGRWRMGYFDGLSARTVAQPMASCLLVRREIFDSVGLFDERYPMFFNDVDWCKRVCDAGFVVFYNPAVRVGHVGGASVRKSKPKMIWMSHAAYFLYLRRLNSGNHLKTALTFLSAPPLFCAAMIRSAWHSLKAIG